ncbi:MAG: O-antigen ligase family protein [Saprospiraceae bacterium]
MKTTAFQHTSPRLWLQKRWMQVLLLLGTLCMGAMMGIAGLKISIVLAVLPVALLMAGLVLVYPVSGLWFALGFSFIASGLTRYVAIPWGLLMDVVLFIAVAGWAVRKISTRQWEDVKNDALLASVGWFVYVLLEMLNPLNPGLEAWFYAMRGLGFYTLIGFLLTFTYLRHPRYVGYFLEVVFVVSVLGAFWGLKQYFIGTDGAEDHWLYVEGHHDEHVLHGVLRAFSFYSDAGQFGASQVMMSLMAGILLLGPFSLKRKMWYAVVVIATLLGFLYSGARGALAVPVAGGLFYMLVSKNFKILVAGLLLMSVGYGILKYTYIGQGFQPVARLRTALSPENPSLLARLRNQRTLGVYLADKPMGGGVGSAGYWGQRFRPGSLLAETPTDSYYVRIWAETGFVGLALHLLLLGYFLGKGSAIAWQLRHPRLRAQILTIMAAYAGVLLANYGNQVFLQFPTGVVMAVGLPLVFMAPYYDEMLMDSNAGNVLKRGA